MLAACTRPDPAPDARPAVQPEQSRRTGRHHPKSHSAFDLAARKLLINSPLLADTVRPPRVPL